MKPRRVVLTLEVETDAPLKTLKGAGNYGLMAVTDYWNNQYNLRVLQAQANVVRTPKAKRAR